MIEYNPRTWKGLLKRLESIKKNNKYLHEEAILQQKTNILYRGQREKAWQLETTLERNYKEKISLQGYLRKATYDIEEIESFTNKLWDLPPYPDIEKEVNKIGDLLTSLPCYEYLVYLRHFGFPSPLLDWSKSPYIALFFAVSGMQNLKKSSLYVYIPTTSGVRSGEISSPTINIHGPYVKADKRHFTQKAWYTTATVYRDSSHEFISHKKAFESNNEPEQDILYKINIPFKLKNEILSYLSEHNINHFTIFHSEDSLIKSIAMKQFN